MGKCVEQKLFEAYQKDKGVRLSREDVSNLLARDDAIRTRVTNTASVDAGVEQPGCDCIHASETWVQFKRRLKADYHGE